VFASAIGCLITDTVSLLEHNPRRVLTLIVREGMMLAAVGFGIGVFAALGLAQAIRTFIYVSPTDLVPLGGAALTTLAATFLASYLPSRRATRIDR
jgi:putative ABC transport system permease protein